MNLQYDVVVIGAGISGMTTARSLEAEGKTVCVVEAADRVGGRTWTKRDAPGGPIDFGGMYIGDTHTHSRTLGLELGLQTTPSEPHGDDLFIAGGCTYIAPAGEIQHLPFAKAYQVATDAIDELSKAVGFVAPWESPLAAELDRITAMQWFQNNIADPTARSLHAQHVRAVLGAEPTEVSMLYWAYYVVECEGMKPLLANRGGAQSDWWIGGAGQLTERMAYDLKGDVLLEWAAARVENHPEHVVISAADGRALRARAVVVAVPPSASHRIQFEPPLSRERRQLAMRTAMGRYSKIIVRYDSPFWERSGLSGCITDADTLGAAVFPGTRRGEAEGSLILFVGAGDQDRLAAFEPPESKKVVLDFLAGALGNQALTPIYYHDTVWTDDAWAQGGPVSYMPPGVLSTSGSALRERSGRIIFAGTEASLQWSGYMEGAVRAGQQAAKDVGVLFAS
ncbi:flavin monoamine oxidase family protein [Arthrobacter sp. 135MFCol5.1]|uniref:flavin monoamine oxidase family protein n=1 Tax=Arthrobacter sp. 135MFCol5.1 TaxID=1158050 RepID=UPI00035E4EBD|nr:FAD-dependent oxidoreductase [Arthrobacter sp. 135MFCol5.1]